jgi:hypothetical protein
MPEISLLPLFCIVFAILAGVARAGMPRPAQLSRVSRRLSSDAPHAGAIFRLQRFQIHPDGTAAEPDTRRCRTFRRRPVCRS